MHHRHVAHRYVIKTLFLFAVEGNVFSCRDCMNLNIMMDPAPLYPEPYHPCAAYMKRDFSGRVKYYTRTERPPKYFFVDFGLSRRYSLEDSDPLEEPIRGGDKTVPEFKDLNKPYNPFFTDVYYLGNLIREDFLVVRLLHYSREMKALSSSSPGHPRVFSRISWISVHVEPCARYGP